MDTEDAAHAGESAVRLNLVAVWREAKVLVVVLGSIRPRLVGDAAGGIGDAGGLLGKVQRSRPSWPQAHY